MLHADLSGKLSPLVQEWLTSGGNQPLSDLILGLHHRKGYMPSTVNLVRILWLERSQTPKGGYY